MNGANGLAARADEFSDLLRIDHDGDDAGSVDGDVGSRRRENSFHLLDDLQTALASKREDFSDLFEPQPARLEIELNSGDAIACAGHFEIHLAEKILLADDVKHVRHLAIGTGEAPDRNARGRGLDWHAGIHHRQAATAHASH